MKSLGIILFYVFLSLIARTLSSIFKLSLWHVSPLWASVSTIWVIISGVALGAIVIVVSHFLDKFPLFSRLNANIARFLPNLSFTDIIILSIASSIGEELLFRGALLQLLGIHASSLLFGFLHYGGKRPFLLWGVMGWVMGYLLGGLFLATGSLLSPILAHFTINHFNLIHLIQTYKIEEEEPPHS